MSEGYEEERALRARAGLLLSRMRPVAFDASLMSEHDALSPWHEAAAVLSTFQLSDLRVARDTTLPATAVLADSAMTLAEGWKRWTLLPAVRIRALAQLGTREQMRSALLANAQRPADGLQKALDAFILGDELRIDRCSATELAAAVEASEWLRPMVKNLPSRQTMLDRLDTLRLYEPFQHLVGDHFHGREAELAQLRRYVDEPQKELRWLVIVAAGGAGKSTLLGKFILDERARVEQRPFIFLDFDRPVINLGNPASLLLEAVRQLGVQYPQNRNACEELRRRWQSEGASSLAAETATRGAFYRRSRMASEFAQLIESLEIDRVPLLFVLDTFEEAQYRSTAELTNLWTFLADVKRGVPKVRFVLAGRTPLPDDVPHEQLSLPDLEVESAHGFLQSRGVAASVAKAVVRQVGRNPLSLRLAAAVLKSEEAGSEGIHGLATKKVLWRIGPAAIQGQLFRRILDHIHDEDVRRLAYPGLVLRRITPQLVQEVLASPCGVRVESAERARELFSELGRELSLVTPAEDGSLRHRADVRRLMLPLLAASDPERMRQIETAAVRFYESQAHLVARAEEIYHRLRLGHASAMIEARWMSGIEPYLRGAIEELTPSGRVLLAQHEIGPAPNATTLRQASQEVWERAAKLKAEAALLNMEPQRALQDMHQRSARLRGSELRLLEARALLRLQRHEQAIKVARRGIDDYGETGNVRLMFEAYLVIAEAAMYSGLHRRAVGALNNAQWIAEEARDTAGLVSVELLRVALDGRDSKPAQETFARLRKHLDAMEDQAIAARPALMRDVVRLLGATQPEVVARAVRIIGFAAPPDVAWREQLGFALEHARPRMRASAREDAVLRHQLEALDDRAGSWRRFVFESTPEALAAWLADLLDAYAEDAQFVALIRERVIFVSPVGDAVHEGAELESLEVAREIDDRRDRLTDVSRQHVRIALEHALNPADFTRMLAVSLNRAAGAESSVQSPVRHVVETADRQGWLRDLVSAAARWCPQNEEVLHVADRVGAGLAIPTWSSRVLVDELIATQRKMLAALDTAVCEVVVNRLTVASGLLIAPDLVVTVDGAWLDAPGSVLLHFTGANGVVAVAVVQVQRHEGGFCFLRLMERPGEHFVDGAWSLHRQVVAVLRAHSNDPSRCVVLWRNDERRPCAAEFRPARLSSFGAKLPPGAPCFDERLEFVGLLTTSSGLPRVITKAVIAAALRPVTVQTEEAFAELYEKHFPRVVRYLMRIGPLSSEEARDLAQDVFVRFYAARDKYRGEAEWAFLRTTARHALLNQVRKQQTKRRAGLSVPLDELAELAAPASADYAEREQRAVFAKRLREAIAGLPEGTGRALQLRSEGFTYAEIARVLAMTEVAVRTRLRDAKEILRKQLGEDLERIAWDGFSEDDG